MPFSKRIPTKRTEADYAVAARMLLRLKQGGDVRPERIVWAREELRKSVLDDTTKLDRAMDILLDEMMLQDHQQTQHLFGDCEITQSPGWSDQAWQ